MEKSPHLRPVILYATNLRNVAAKTKDLARDIKLGLYGTPKSLHFVIEDTDGDLTIGGFGESDPYRAKGILAAATNLISGGGCRDG